VPPTLATRCFWDAVFDLQDPVQPFGVGAASSSVVPRWSREHRPRLTSPLGSAFKVRHGSNGVEWIVNRRFEGPDSP